jgi:hypothetical protein
LPKNNTPFQGTFSRHGKSQASLALLIWLNENVPFQGTFFAMAELKQACSAHLA